VPLSDQARSGPKGVSPLTARMGSKGGEQTWHLNQLRLRFKYAWEILTASGGVFQGDRATGIGPSDSALAGESVAA